MTHCSSYLMTFQKLCKHGTSLTTRPRILITYSWEKELKKIGDDRARLLERVRGRIQDERQKCRAASHAIFNYQLEAVKRWKREHFLTWQKAIEPPLPQYRTIKRRRTNCGTAPNLRSTNPRLTSSPQRDAVNHAEGGVSPATSANTEVDLSGSDNGPQPSPLEDQPWKLPPANVPSSDPLEDPGYMNNMAVGLPRPNPAESGQSNSRPRLQAAGGCGSGLEQVLGPAAQSPSWLQESESAWTLLNLRTTSGPNQAPNTSFPSPPSSVFQSSPWPNSNPADWEFNTGQFLPLSSEFLTAQLDSGSSHS